MPLRKRARQRSSPTVVLMARSDKGKRDTTTGRSAWKRFGHLMYEWLILLACLSGNITFRINAHEDDAPWQSRPPSERARSRLQTQSEGRRKVEEPDLHTQYEDLLDTVWRCERQERLYDRIEAQIRFERSLRKRCGGDRAD
jgi:hypothetical protein